MATNYATFSTSFVLLTSIGLIRTAGKKVTECSIVPQLQENIVMQNIEENDKNIRTNQIHKKLTRTTKKHKNK